jgi:hypothetical protein
MVFNSGGGGKYWLAGLLVSVGIFAVIYFTVIKPTTDTANRAINQSLHQVNRGEKLANCMQAAGTSMKKMHACQAKFTP